jgi:hypothetical protein
MPSLHVMKKKHEPLLRPDSDLAGGPQSVQSEQRRGLNILAGSRFDTAE